MSDALQHGTDSGHMGSGRHKFADELHTLQRLKQQVEVAIGCIELRQVREDDSYKAGALSYDFRVGDFEIHDTRKRLYKR